MSILTYIAGWPLLAALVLVVVPRNYRVIIRAIALAATFVPMVLAIKMSNNEKSLEPYGALIFGNRARPKDAAFLSQSLRQALGIPR